MFRVANKKQSYPPSRHCNPKTLKLNKRLKSNQTASQLVMNTPISHLLPDSQEQHGDHEVVG